MKKIATACFLLAIFSTTNIYAQPAVSKTEQIGPWNMAELKKSPTFHWELQKGPIHSLLYQGEPYKGHDTEVFAFYASPATLGLGKPGQKYPGVVLIHGGGGTAFAEWVWLWAKRGYAVIAMDLAGHRPIDPIFDDKGVPVFNQTGEPETRKRLPNGGPDQGHGEKFDTIGGDRSDDWPYHAVANVVRAHSLLRSLPEVDADRTAVTGISWGGYTTCLVASVDDRFKAAVPVYGCGFLHEGESVQKPAIDQLKERRADWVREYDPSSWLARCRVPILFVNGTNDMHYPMDSYLKSFNLVPAPKQMRMLVNMPHGHHAGWQPEEIGLFIDSYCNSGKPLPFVGEVRETDETARADFKTTVPLKSAALHFTTDTGLRSARKWKSVPAKIADGEISATGLPAAANTWFITVTDQRGAVVSSPIRFR